MIPASRATSDRQSDHILRMKAIGNIPVTVVNTERFDISQCFPSSLSVGVVALSAGL